MINESAVKVLESIARRYSYVSKSRKYRNSVDGSIVTLDNAVESVLSEFALNHTTEYAPYQNKREELATTVRECIKGATRERKQRQVTRSIEATQTGATTSSLGGKSTHNPGWKPFMTFNMIDLEWCHGIKYCPTSNTIYGTTSKGALEVIGTVGDNVTIIKMAKRLSFDPHEYILKQLEALRSIYFILQTYEQEGPEKMLSVKVSDNKTLTEYLEIKEGDRKPQTVEEITTRLIHHMLNNTLPASVFTGLAKILVYHEAFTDDDGNTNFAVKDFLYDMGKQGFLTGKAYFANIIENYIERLPVIDLPEAIQYDGEENTNAFGIWNQEAYDEDMEKYDGLAFNDSQIIRTYLDPMTHEQKTFVVAWWYALVHAHEKKMLPSMLQMDKGGTLKNTVANIIKLAMTKYYGCECHYNLNQDKLTNDQYSYNSFTQKSLGDAVWCHYDEVATKGPMWDKFKSMTGGPKVDVLVKKLYSNPYNQQSSVVFFFASNRPVYIQDMGAFRRRLVIISTKGDNTYKNIPIEFRNKMNDDRNVQFREFVLLMKIGKVAYEKLVKTYGGLVEAACSMKDISSELETSSPWDEYYEGFYASLFEEDQAERTISNADIVKLFSAYKSTHISTLNLDENGMRKYCLNAMPENTKKSVWNANERRGVKGMLLHAPVYQRTSDMEEYIPIGEPLRPGMNLEPGNVKKTDPMDAVDLL